MKKDQNIIVQRDNDVLRKTAEEVSITEITSPKIQKIIDDMEKALEKEADGVGLAAPQIGISLRIFIISELAFRLDEQAKNKEVSSEDKNENKNRSLVFINPVITKLSKDKSWMEEGCLSVRWAYGKIKRSNKATITAYDRFGKKFTRGGSGVMAEIFQHEVDHLNGILFIDNAKDLKEAPPAESK